MRACESVELADWAWRQAVNCKREIMIARKREVEGLFINI
jgi:hypothetical protein